MSVRNMTAEPLPEINAVAERNNGCNPVNKSIGENSIFRALSYCFYWRSTFSLPLTERTFRLITLLNYVRFAGDGRMSAFVLCSLSSRKCSLLLSLVFTLLTVNSQRSTVVISNS